jgi:hypothetical protein
MQIDIPVIRYPDSIILKTTNHRETKADTLKATEANRRRGPGLEKR